MTLKGDLDSISLADVFQTLSMTQQEGTLVVQNPDQKKCIFFSAHGVSLITTAEKKTGRLGDLLVGLGKITSEQLDQALEHHTQQGLRLGEALIELQYVTQDDIEQAVRQQIEEEIYDLFSWENASFEFVEGPPDEGFLTAEGLPITKLTFNVNALIMEAARRIDEWDLIEKFIPTLKEIFIPDDRLDVSSYSEQEQVLLRLLDGTRNVKELVRESHMPKFDVCKFLYRLLEDGKARPVEFEGLIACGDAAVKSENLEEAVKFYEQAVEAKVKKRSDQLKARMRLGQALEYAGRKKEAAKHYKILAEQKMEEGDFESAISIWHKVIDFDPLDLENKERLINLYLENRHQLDSNKSDMIRQIELSLFKNGRSLAMAFSYAGQTERAQEVLNRLIELAPSNVDLRKALVNIYFDSGDKEAAVEELERISQFLLAAHDYEQLVEIYRNILKIDPSRNDVRKKISMIEGGEVIHVQGRRRFGKVIVIFLVLILLGGAAAMVYYQMQAMDRWEKVRVEVDKRWKTGEREQARQVLKNLKAELPYTLVLKKIDAMLEEYAEIEKAEKEKKEFTLQSECEKVVLKFEQIYKILHASSDPLDDPELITRLDELLEVCRKNPFAAAKNLPVRLVKEKEWIAAQIDNARRIFERAKEIEAEAERRENYKGLLPEAWKVWMKLYDEGRRVPTYWNKILLPVRVESVPPKAQAMVNGKVAYVTPFTYYKKPGTAVSVDLKRRGYDSTRINMETEDLKNFEMSSKYCFASHPLSIHELFPRVTFKGRVSTPLRCLGDTLVIATIVSGKIFTYRLIDDQLLLKLSGLKPSNHPLNYGFDTTPGVAESRIFLGCQDGRVYSVDTAQGSKYRLQSFDTKIGQSGKIGVDGGGVLALAGAKLVIVGTTQGLFAFDLETAELAWHFSTPKPVNSLPVLVGEQVIFSCNNAVLYAVPLRPKELKDGVLEKPLWAVRLPGMATTVPAVHGKMLFLGVGDSLLRLDLDKLVPENPDTWKITHTPFRAGGTLRGRIVAVGETLCISSQDGYVYAVEFPAIEKVRWRFNAGSYRTTSREPITSVVRSGDSLFLGNGAGRIFSLHARTGTVNWVRELEGRIVLAPAVSESGVVFVISQLDESMFIHGFKE